MRRLAGTASRHSQLLTLASPFWGNYKHLIYWFCVQLCVQYKLCLSVCVCVGRRFWYGWSPLLKLQWLTSFWLISSVMEELLSFNNWLVTHTQTLQSWVAHKNGCNAGKKHQSPGYHCIDCMVLQLPPCISQAHFTSFQAKPRGNPSFWAPTRIKKAPHMRRSPSSPSWCPQSQCPSWSMYDPRWIQALYAPHCWWRHMFSLESAMNYEMLKCSNWWMLLISPDMM